MSATNNNSNLTPQDCKLIAELFLGNQLGWKSVYYQSKGERTLQPVVSDAIDAYKAAQVTCTSTYSVLMEQAAERFRAFGLHNQALACEQEAVSQINLLADAHDGVDITTIEAVANNRAANHLNRRVA